MTLLEGLNLFRLFGKGKWGAGLKRFFLPEKDLDYPKKWTFFSKKKERFS